MNKFFQNVAILLVLSAGMLMTGIKSANAACYGNTHEIPNGSPPVVLSNGLWCTQDQYQNYNGMNIPFGLMNGQQFLTRNQQGQMLRCSWKDRVASGAMGMVAGGGLGFAIDILSRNTHGQDAYRFTKAGAVSGAVTQGILNCDPEIIDDGERVASRQTSTKTYDGKPTSVNGHTCAVLNQDGNVVVDFLDASRNPKGIVVKSGEECQKARAPYQS